MILGGSFGAGSGIDSIEMLVSEDCSNGGGGGGGRGGVGGDIGLLRAYLVGDSNRGFLLGGPLRSGHKFLEPYAGETSGIEVLGPSALIGGVTGWL